MNRTVKQALLGLETVVVLGIGLGFAVASTGGPSASGPPRGAGPPTGNHLEAAATTTEPTGPATGSAGAPEATASTPRPTTTTAVTTPPARPPASAVPSTTTVPAASPPATAPATTEPAALAPAAPGAAVAQTPPTTRPPTTTTTAPPPPPAPRPPTTTTTRPPAPTTTQPPGPDSGVYTMSPDSGPAGGGTTVTIRGYGFNTHGGLSGGYAAVYFVVPATGSICAYVDIRSYTASQIVGTTGTSYADGDPNNCASQGGPVTLQVYLADGYVDELRNAFTFG